MTDSPRFAPLCLPAGLLASLLLASGLLASGLLASGGCNYAKPVMHIDIVNHSGHPMQNLEVQYPTDRGPGQFGLPELGDEQTHRHMVPAATPCKLGIQFDDRSGRHYSNSFDLGAKCPTEIVFEVGSGMSVSQRTERP